MRSVNKVILVGNLTRDPSVKETSQGQKVVTFTVATNREWVSNGDKKTLAEFHNVAVWGRLSSVCENHLRKGKLVYIEGYLKTRSWDTPEGVRISRTEIVAYDMIMLNKRGEVGEDDYTGEISDDEKESLEMLHQAEQASPNADFFGDLHDDDLAI
ncbi:MAG TPA: single-stranded DNA-binding protein [Candidatus Gracilibacteria bacterium]|nr:single-stranded DNA-binding protein [Candidatus Gracilibacteria bacterium]